MQILLLKYFIGKVYQSVNIYLNIELYHCLWCQQAYNPFKKQLCECSVHSREMKINEDWPGQRRFSQDEMQVKLGKDARVVAKKQQGQWGEGRGAYEKVKVC